MYNWKFLKSTHQTYLIVPYSTEDDTILIPIVQKLDIPMEPADVIQLFFDHRKSNDLLETIEHDYKLHLDDVSAMFDTIFADGEISRKVPIYVGTYTSRKYTQLFST